MIFGHQTRGAIVQVLSTISAVAAEAFLYKHLGVSEVPSFLPLLVSAPPEALKTMLTELLANNKILYGAAPVKHAFKTGIEEHERWALHDGWVVETGILVRVTPAAEEATGIRDKFLQDIQTSGLDADGAIEILVEDSSKDFVAVPPDFNGSITKIRIALETLARRARLPSQKRRAAVTLMTRGERH